MSEDEKPDINTVLEHLGTRIKDKRSYMTNCVLHEDRTPSLSVNTERGLWNCKSCGKAGDSYTLIMLKEDVDFGRAREIAASLGLSTGGSGGGSDDVRGGYYSGRRSTPRGTRDRQERRAYVPAWRRS